MKKLLIIAVTILGVLSVSGQNQPETNNKFKYNAALILGIPVGNANNYIGHVLGGDVQAEYKLATKINATVSAEYLSYSNKNGPNAFKIIPLLAGAKFYLSDNFYTHLQMGLSFPTGKNHATDHPFTYSPSIGYDLSTQFDIALKYQTIVESGGNTSFIGIRAAFNF